MEFIFNPAGQHTSSFDVINHWENEGWAYWGAAPVVFYASSTTQFQFQDWLGTERMRRKYDGSSEGSFTSLPFGSGSGTSGSDWDQYHFAGLDHDSGSNTDHAQFRQYANAAGRWMSPDPFSGSYDFTNPQSFNRYAYVGNNPLSATDVSGLMMCNECFWGSGGPTNVPSDGGLSMGGWDGMYGLWDVGPNGAMFAGDPDTHSGPWGGGGGSGHVCILGWCVSWGSGVPTLGFPGNTSGIWNEGLGLPAGMRLPVGDPAQTIQQVFGLPTMADVNCLPFCDANQASNNNQQQAQARVTNCVNQGHAAGAQVPSPAPSGQDWLEGVGAAVIGTATGNPWAAVGGMFTGFAKVGGIRAFQRLMVEQSTTIACLNQGVYNPGSSLTGGVE